MTQYEVPLLHSSQDMMQELFEEINDYLGDKEKSAMISPASPVLSPFNVSTEGEEDEHSIEHTQNDNNIMMNQSEPASQTQSTPLQPAMFVESDDEDPYTDRGDTSDLSHVEGNHIEEAVCVCYKCKNNQTGYSGHQQANENTNYDKTTSALSQLSPFKRRSKSSSSYGGNAVGNAKLAHIAGLVKQTLTSTPRDILPTTASSHKRPTNTRRHSTLSTSPTLDKANSSSTPLESSSSATSRSIYNPSQEKNGIHFSSLASSYKDDNLYSENDTLSGDPKDRNDNNSGASFNKDVDYQEKNDSWMMMATGISGDLVSSMNWSASAGQNIHNQSGSSLYNEQDMDNADQSAQATTTVYLHSYPEEKQQLPDDLPLTQQLPFLTPIHRIGEPHSIVLRTKLARDVGSHEDRINAYNNAYSHCIMARTDMVPWIKKQYSKGPPSLILQYTPRRKKSSKSLFGLFKRHSKLNDTPSSTSLAVNCSSNVSKLSMSSARSSLLTESIPAASPQPPFTPSDSYFPQDQGQQPVLQQISNDAVSSFILPNTSPSNDDDMYLSPSDSSGSKAYKNVSNHKAHEQQHRSPSPSRPTASGKRQPKSLASVAEPVSILKKSASTTDVTARTDGSMLKNSPSAASFVGEDLSPGYQNMSPASAIGVTENGNFAVPNMKKQRYPSPSPSVEVRGQPSRRRSPSPMSYGSTSSSSGHSKRNQLLCPPDSRSPPHQRSRSVSPSPNQARPQRSRSLSPLAPPMRRLSLHDEYGEEPRHYAMDHRRSPSPSPTSSRRQYAPPPLANRHLSPRRLTNDDNTRHYRSNSNTSSPGGYHNKEKMERKIHRTRSTEHYDNYPSRYPPMDSQDNDSAIMMMDRRPRRSSYVPSTPLHYDEASPYLLPLEEQYLPQRLPSHRCLRSNSPNHPPPLLISTGRRVTEPPNTHLRHRDRSPIPRRGSMVEEEDYYRQEDGYVSQKLPRGSNHPKRRHSSILHQPPLAKQQQSPSPQHHHDALHDLCVFFQHLPKHVLANYLQDAGGDFFLAKDLCMEDIMANGI